MVPDETRGPQGRTLRGERQFSVLVEADLEKRRSVRSQGEMSREEVLGSVRKTGSADA
jgi:hypothetical protein